MGLIKNKLSKSRFLEIERKWKTAREGGSGGVGGGGGEFKSSFIIPKKSD